MKKTHVILFLCIALLGAITTTTQGAILDAGGLPDPTFDGGAMLLWLRADAGVTTDGGGKVTAWADQSTYGYSVAQTASAAQPTLNLTGGPGGMPVVEFFSDDGTGDYLDVGGGLTGQQTMIIVYYDDSTRSYATPVGTSYNGKGSYHGNSDDSLIFATGHADPATLNGSNYRNGVVAANPPRPDTWALDAHVATVPLTQTVVAIGADQPCCGNRSINGGIAEVLLYNQELTWQQVNAVGYYLESKYELATNHYRPPTFEPSGLVVDDADPNFRVTGRALPVSNTILDVSGWSINDQYYTFNAQDIGTNTAIWSPDLEPGEYYVQVNWVAHPAHSPSVTYTVNHAGGSDAFDVNQTFAAAQHPLPIEFNNTTFDHFASGWHTLGVFTLDETSTVEMILNSGNYGAVDAVRFSKSLSVDELERAAYPAGTWNASYLGNADPETTAYAHTQDATGEVIYTLGVTGLFELDASWVAHPLHTGSALYTIDLDGDLLTTGDQTVWEINQKLQADDAAVTTHVWSGWKPLGTFALTAESIVQITAGPGFLTNDFLIADNLLLTPVPEPTAWLLALLGLAALLVCRKRR